MPNPKRKEFNWTDMALGLIALIVGLMLYLPSAFPVQAKIVQEVVIMIMISFTDFVATSNLFEGLSLVLFGITVPIFVLTVTFVGPAARIAKEQQEREQKENQDSFDRRIADLKKQIEEHPKDLDELQEQIEELRTQKRKSEKQLIRIAKKYTSLGFKEAVILPSSCFLLVILFQKILTLEIHLFYKSLLVGLIFGLLGYGIRKIMRTLSVVQEISLRSEGDRMTELSQILATTLENHGKPNTQSSDLTTALEGALRAIEKEKEPRPYITFSNELPFTLKMNEEAKISFSIDMRQPGAREGKNAEVFIMISPEINIKESSGYASFKQKSNYTIPNANTAKWKYPKIRKHTYYGGVLTVTPTKSGKYSMEYSVECDGYVETPKLAEIIVLD